jgi:hypothetical protein
VDSRLGPGTVGFYQNTVYQNTGSGFGQESFLLSLDKAEKEARKTGISEDLSKLLPISVVGSGFVDGQFPRGLFTPMRMTVRNQPVWGVDTLDFLGRVLRADPALSRQEHGGTVPLDVSPLHYPKAQEDMQAACRSLPGGGLEGKRVLVAG